MNKIVRNIPNTITCGNLLCGCLALVKAFEGDLVWAAYLVGIAVVLDFMDGFLARLLNVSSPIGKDLDSLADMVTFGVVPGVIVFQLFNLLPSGEVDVTSYYTFLFTPHFLRNLSFLIPIFSAIRLARFNNDTRQAESFIGLPTPANAIFFSSLPLVGKQISEQLAKDYNPFELLIKVSSDPVLALLMNPWFLLALVILFSALLVAPIRFFALKFKSFGWKGDEIRFIFLGMAAGLIAWLQFVGIPLVIVLYILMSIIHNLVARSSK